MINTDNPNTKEFIKEVLKNDDIMDGILSDNINFENLYLMVFNHIIVNNHKELMEIFKKTKKDNE